MAKLERRIVLVEITDVEYERAFWFFKRPIEAKVKIDGEMCGKFEMSKLGYSDDLELRNDKGKIIVLKISGEASIYTIFSIDYDVIPEKLIQKKLDARWRYSQIDTDSQHKIVSNGGFLEVVKREKVKISQGEL